MDFKIGDTVSWKSQSQGSCKEKIGKIIVVIPSKVHPNKILWSLLNKPCSWKIMFDGYARDHESYLIEVPSKSGRGKPKLYWPRVSGLAVVSNGLFPAPLKDGMPTE